MANSSKKYLEEYRLLETGSSAEEISENDPHSPVSLSNTVYQLHYPVYNITGRIVICFSLLLNIVFLTVFALEYAGITSTCDMAKTSSPVTKIYCK